MHGAGSHCPYFRSDERFPMTTWERWRTRRTRIPGLTKKRNDGLAKRREMPEDRRRGESEGGDADYRSTVAGFKGGVEYQSREARLDGPKEHPNQR
ncbi:hypothetical protein NDU88_004153 [Pleurodeles waltl]|uniref:Uncharacterized protein n=1 Tax=Pleurodeles waltl TaxID=8319 RepID=A0AAV7REY2_PLEWA|nr:hypothetical protein NDU88_004153 [Pleurodeles waltl]